MDGDNHEIFHTTKLQGLQYVHCNMHVQYVLVSQLLSCSHSQRSALEIRDHCPCLMLDGCVSYECSVLYTQYVYFAVVMQLLFRGVEWCVKAQSLYSRQWTSMYLH